MAIDYERLMNWPFEDIEHTYSSRESILYALGCGLGGNPLDAGQLRYVYEDGLQALPTMAVVLAYPGFWIKEQDSGIDWLRVVHGEQSVEIRRPLPPSGTVLGRTRVTGIVDKGSDKGALLYSERTIRDKDSGEVLAHLESTTFCRGDGGYGGPSDPVKPSNPLPDRAPDTKCTLSTAPQQALVYRLSGDYNPLHADPEVARKAGFDRPILHGLSTFAVAGHALLRTLCGYDPSRLKSLSVRFSAPVYPGESISTDMWIDGDAVAFRSVVEERDAVVLSNGLAQIDPE